MWYTTKELADILEVTERTIQRRAKKGVYKTKKEPGHGGDGEIYKVWYDEEVNDTSTTSQRHKLSDNQRQ